MATRKQISFFEELKRQGRPSRVDSIDDLSVPESWDVISKMLQQKGDGSVYQEDDFNDQMVNDFKDAKDNNFNATDDELDEIYEMNPKDSFKKLLELKKSGRATKEQLTAAAQRSSKKKKELSDFKAEQQAQEDKNNKDKSKKDKESKVNEARKSMTPDQVKDSKAGFDIEDLGKEGYTNVLKNAMWVTPTGKLIDGKFENGLRSKDHRNVLLQDDYEGINKAAASGAIRVMNETKSIQTEDGSLDKLSGEAKKQAEKYINNLGYKIEKVS